MGPGRWANGLSWSVAVASPEQYLADLNPAQREAVLATEGPVLVVAGAGSGKTRVLTHRIVHLINGCGVQPHEILAITFTNKAAGEMKRAARGRPRRRRADDVGDDLPRRLRTDPAPRGAAPRLPLELHDLRPGRPGPGREAVPGGARPRPEALRAARHPRADLEREEPARRPGGVPARVASFYDQTVADVYEVYQRRLFASNALDFDDLLMLTVEVLERFPEARKRWQKAFRYVLVDEYQDTNHAQYRLLQLLAGEHRNVFAVGDPDQSIYAFRGADIRNILEFEQDFGERQGDPLEQNYRSTNSILARRTRSSRTTASGSRRTSGASSARASRSASSRSRTSTPRRASSPPRSRRSSTRATRLGDRGLLPDERAVAGDRGRARPTRTSPTR